MFHVRPSGTRETVWHTVMFDPEMHAFVFEKRRIAGTFVENLELYQFPFDTQVRRKHLPTKRPRILILSLYIGRQ